MMNVAYMTVLTTPEMIAAPAVAVVIVAPPLEVCVVTAEWQLVVACIAQLSGRVFWDVPPHITVAQLIAGFWCGSQETSW